MAKPKTTTEAVRYTRDGYSVVFRLIDGTWVMEPPLGSGLETFRITAETLDERDAKAEGIIEALATREHPNATEAGFYKALADLL